jgi:hypothetical protein
MDVGGRRLSLIILRLRWSIVTFAHKWTFVKRVLRSSSCNSVMVRMVMMVMVG